MSVGNVEQEGKDASKDTVVANDEDDKIRDRGQ